MAKVDAPLFSFGARGSLARSLTYFPWKGINAVRSYVVPANPNTDAQIAQRAHMTAAMAEWHGAAYSALDVVAWNRWATSIRDILSGVNQFCRHFLNENILGNAWERLHHIFTSGVAANTFNVELTKTSGGNAPTVYWGTRLTHFPNSMALTDLTGDLWRAILPGLIASTLYYFYIDVGSSGTDYARTGIYQQRTTA